jgi:phage terminase large subunit
MFKTTDVFLCNRNAPTDIVVNQGGTSSGKTFSILQNLFLHAIEESNQVITIVGQDIPNLKVGALRDAHTIIEETPELQAFITDFNKSDRVFTFINGSIIEFKSYDNSQDAKSGKRDYLFINEANGIDKNIWEELYFRTRKKSYLDYNPNVTFWVHQHLIGKSNVTLIISDHRHNTYLDDKTHSKIENIEDYELWKVYARGLTGKLEGVIFREYNVIDKVPDDAKLVGYGLDFGFTNDPSTLVAVYKHSGELILEELIYEAGMLNRDISVRMFELGIKGRIIADSSEPKSIAELQGYGWQIEGAIKGNDSVRQGINSLKRYKINVTKNSYNIKKEFDNYKWKQGKTGELQNEPIDMFNHTIDAIRYVALNILDNFASGKYNFMR